MENPNIASSLIVQLLAESGEKEEGGDLLGAVERAQQALAEAQNANAFSILITAETHLAHLLARTGDHEEAARLASAVVESASTAEEKVNAQVILGICAAETNDPERGEEEFHRALEISRRAGYREGMALALHNLASSIYMPRGQFDLALRTMEEAQQFRPKNGKPDWGLPFLQAYIHALTGNRKRARQALDELLPLVKPASRVAGAYFYLWARLALDEEELEKAEEYLHLTMHIATATGAPDLNVWYRVEYSRYYRLKGDPAVARNWAEDGVRYARRVRSHQLAGEALIETAQACWESGDHEAAERDLMEAEITLIPCQSAYNLARITFLRAAWLHQRQDPQAEDAWTQTSQALSRGGYIFLLERERDAAFPLIAAYLRSRNPAARQSAETLLGDLERVAPPPLRILGLGEFSVWQGRQLIPDQNWQRRKAGELFRYLLLQPGRTAGREVIIEALWPDHIPQTAIDLLHQSTSTLRHILEPDLPDKFPSRYLFVEGERVSLRLPESSTVDFDDFQQRLPQAIQARKIDGMQSILALYRGDLFPSDRYTDWSAGRREALAELYLHGKLALGQAYLLQQQFQEAVSCSRIILQRDPWNEDAVLLGMQAYLGLRDAPRAMKLYRKLEQVLKEELDLTPRSDLRSLVENIRRKE